MACIACHAKVSVVCWSFLSTGVNLTDLPDLIRL